RAHLYSTTCSHHSQIGLRLKNKCGPGQPPGPHCYRGRSDCRLSLGRKIIAQMALRKVPCRDAHLRLARQGYDSTLSSSLEGGFLWRPQSPGTGALDMRRISPGDSLSKITGNAEPLSDQMQNISRF